jgi:phosphoadenosine phosphosulfate reductase
MLVENTLFGTIDKVQISLDRIKEFEPPEGYYVAFSGGKDSVVLLDLVKRAGVKYDAHYNITGIDPPELFYFIRDRHPEVQRHRPEMTMWKLIVKTGMPPTRIARYCCAYLKERGGTGRVVLTGIRWAESDRRRNTRKAVETCYKKQPRFLINPIIEWTDKDVWQYIRMNGVKYCSLYDEGFKRLGCIGCPMADRHRAAEFARWPRIERLWKKSFQALLDQRLARPIEWQEKHPLPVAWSTAELMFSRWLYGHGSKFNPNQTTMFE